ncbi:DUF1292 domain-containing protein [Peptoniphilus equinus]|uniref:DUF1292 domain-containing protein n=1 Tax=Peptoniphilus equinus TaxID=3016343 RepID=A0ABY7QVC0_9FIRM|nr:DUF1292 domain-containing protein [Peptoniphilus equinus]WBW50732.1 DUF1292 domain-containing protein [Peptoniphilus equinus]
MTEHQHNCGCNHDHEHEHEETYEYDVISIPMEDGGELDCVVIDTFEVDGGNYIALVAEDEVEDGDILLFKYEELEDEEIELVEIESEEEFDRVAEVFNQLGEDEE